MRGLFLKNSFVNLVGGASAAIFNLALPALLIRHLSSTDFLVWNLALQVLVHMQLFGFGIQASITRYVAVARSTNDIEDQKKTLNAGFLLVGIFILFAVVALGAMLVLYPQLFTKIPYKNLDTFRICLAVIGISAALQLLALVPIGYFIGHQKNYIPVLIQITVRAICLLVIWIVVKQDVGLIELSLAFAVTSLLLVPISLTALIRSRKSLLYKNSTLCRARFYELLSFCGTLATWNVGMLLILGLSTLIVGYYDFKMVTSYSLASVVVAVFLGIQQSIMSPLLAVGSTLFAKNTDQPKLANLLNLTTAACLVGLLLSVLFVKFYGQPLLELWLGAEKGRDVYPLLLILLVANSIRNSALPYSLLLMAVDLQQIVRFTALAEGVVTVIASLVLAGQYGAYGVAYGALTGALSGLLFNFVFNFKKTRILVPNVWEFSLKSLSVFFIPFLLILLR